MSRGLLALVTLILLVVVFDGLPVGQAPSGRVDFGRDVRPIFEAHCFECHGPSQQMNGYRLDRRRDAMRIRDGGTVIGPGNSAASRLYLRIIAAGYGAAMPPNGRLSAQQSDTIKRWIDEGAEWPDALSGEQPATPADPRAERLMDALRRDDRAQINAIVESDPAAANLKGAGGSTPLMFAALYGDRESVRRLLAAGADPALRNDAGVTALMWAVDDLDKTRLLLDARGTDVNARSNDGHTALTAAGRYGSAEVVRLLLDRGAVIANPTPGGPTLLSIAIPESTARMLAERKPAPGGLGGVFRYAVFAGCQPCADVLLPFATPGALNAAIFEAARFADLGVVQTMLRRGTDPNVRGTTGLPRGWTPLHLAAASEKAPTDTVKALIAAGADVHATGRDGATALDVAMLQGETPVVALLRSAGVKPASPSQAADTRKPASAGTARAAIERSIPLLQRTDVTFLRKSGCVSCHNNSVVEMALAAARHHGIRVDDEVERRQLEIVGEYVSQHQEIFLGGRSVPGDYGPVAYLLAGFAAESHPDDVNTDLMARSVKSAQKPDGHWRSLNTRPPIEATDISMTALALKVIRRYPPPPHRAEYERAVQRAADWLAGSLPNGTEERAFKLLGLNWAGRTDDTVRAVARDLLERQRPDGGWAQLPSLASDAYATGEALVALTEAGGLSASDPVYVRGMRFLLSTQFTDGSWHVKTRTLPLQPYFEAGFPWGRDQFISAAATSWAVMALAPAVK
jgi:ankyrin repeat protein